MELGKITKTFKLEDCPSDKQKFVCNECARETSHSIVSSFHESGFDDAGNGCGMDWDERHQIIQCCGCDTVSFRIESTHSEDVDYSFEHDTLVRNITENYFPNRTHQLREINTYLLPLNVQVIYRETTSAISSGLFVLAGIGVRALIETVCKEQNAQGKNLFAKIDSLYQMSVITKEGSDTLHRLRSLGNEAAHEVKPQSEEQLYMAMQIIDHMLEGTYIIPQRMSQVFGKEG
ncbi:DUF4145 domain-containing protein [Vibrio parahaemolyticus]|uniref:DUF4145 domain-containing protein n=1 Tax=Vibrio parahaemolyticus TaxID=670 RepID=A0A8H9K4D0_VIBPH|nr:DUF4145 domain-containing protein [Vibrio parahaemolyticus]EKD9327783.1 DUF4145 domain-containing protein [Vibrio vulnificus]MBS9861668.1 DUF4145 domain-containing protein [Vibrio alginolyticus]MDK9763262.1 DUF4145 domain-containing protein [Vibrio sp. D420a]EHR6437377.1 DUF4145 domain-containing protein [Vibrio parahaemolyticus]